MSSRIECLNCGCPAALEDDGGGWECPYCGCGFARFVLVYEAG